MGGLSSFIHISAELGVKFANVSFTASFTVLLAVKLLNSAADDLQGWMQAHHWAMDNNQIGGQDNKNYGWQQAGTELRSKVKSEGVK